MSAQGGARKCPKVEIDLASSSAKSKKRKAGVIIAEGGGGASSASVVESKGGLSNSEIMKAWLIAGIPLAKLDDMHPLLKSLDVDMVDSSELREHIGPLRKEEHLKLAKDLGGGHYSIAFDASPVFDQEAFGVVVRVVTEDLKVVERLVHLHLLEEPMTTIAPEVFDALRQISGLENRDNCVAIHYDSCAAHLKAVQDVLLDDLYVNAVGIQCMGHLFNHAGETIDTEKADTLTEGLEGLLVQKCNAQRQWKSRFGKGFKHANSARWGDGAHERNEDIVDNFPMVESFLRECEDSDGILNLAAQRIVKWLDSKGHRIGVILELAILCDVGGALATATSELRDETPLIEKAWDIVQRVATVLGADSDQLQDPLLPHVEAVLSELTDGLEGDLKVAQMDALRRNCEPCIKELREYVFEQIGGHDEAVFRKQLLLYKAARNISPAFIVLHGSAAAVDLSGFAMLPYVTPKILLLLTQELPCYYARAKSLPDRSIATRDFWLCYQEDLPTWFKLVRVLRLIEPSSAMMEGVFSAMNTAFGNHETDDPAVPNDLFELAVQLSFNRGRGRGGKGGGGLGRPKEVL